MMTVYPAAGIRDDAFMTSTTGMKSRSKRIVARNPPGPAITGLFCLLTAAITDYSCLSASLRNGIAGLKCVYFRQVQPVRFGQCVEFRNHHP